jgi:hypothetical protein
MEPNWQFLAATEGELKELLKIVDTEFKYERNWDWLIKWCGDERSTWTVGMVIEVFNDEDYWRRNFPTQWR